MDAADQHLPRKPFFVILRALGAISPDLARGVVHANHMLELAAIRRTGRRHMLPPDKTETAIDADVRLVTDHR